MVGEIPKGASLPEWSPAAHVAVTATLRDLDGNGHVNNAVYVTWFEVVRTRYVYAVRGLERMDEMDFILAQTLIRHRASVRLFETVDLYCAPTRVGTSSWDLVYELRARSDGRVAADGHTVLVQYDYANERSAPIDGGFRSVLERDRVAMPEGLSGTGR